MIVSTSLRLIFAALLLAALSACGITQTRNPIPAEQIDAAAAYGIEGDVAVPADELLEVEVLPPRQLIAAQLRPPDFKERREGTEFRGFGIDPETLDRDVTDGALDPPLTYKCRAIFFCGTRLAFTHLSPCPIKDSTCVLPGESIIGK